MRKNSSTEKEFSLDQALESLAARKKGGKTLLEDVVTEFHDIGFAVIMFLLSMPVAIPLPYPPGSTAIFGIPLLILSVQMMLGYREVRLPKRITNYQISNAKIIIFAEKAQKILPYLEKYLDLFSTFVLKIFSPILYIFLRIFKRKIHIGGGKLLIGLLEKVMGAVSFICAICISSPIPFTHSIPAWGIAIMALGLLKRDVLIMLLGMIVSFIGLIISYGFIIATIKFFNWM
jgi:hypothetical protein